METKQYELGKEDLKIIIEELAKEKHVFSNEAQFQFCLAWAINKKLESEFEDYEVVLEEQIQSQKYTDIVVRIGKSYFPIELKYKTADREVNYVFENREYVTYCQGAADNGSYDYLADIARIEKLKNDKLPDGSCFSKGFAIIVTNYPLYWGEGIRLSSNWYPFCFNKELRGTIDWQNKKPTKKERQDAISLEGCYKMDWQYYPHGCTEKDGNRYPIKYMIQEIV